MCYTPTMAKSCCLICSVDFDVPIYELNKGWGRYCSRACANKARAKSIPERFWPKVERAAHGCWPWIGAVRRDGYGSFKDGAAHRISWLLAHGSVPSNFMVLHHCDNKICVNPEHLFLGTALDNAADMTAKGRGRGGRPFGTKLSPESLASFREKKGWTKRAPRVKLTP